MESIHKGDDLFPVSTPQRLIFPSISSRRLCATLHHFTPRVKDASSKETGYYPRDIYLRRAVNGLGKEQLHFHQHTIDVQGVAKILRNDIQKTCADLLQLEDGVDYTFREKNCYFTRQQAAACIDLLGPISFGSCVYTPRLLTLQDIDAVKNMLAIDDAIGQSARRKLFSRLLNMVPNQPYLLDDGALSIGTIDTKKHPQYIGIEGPLTSSQAGGLLRICFDKTPVSGSQDSNKG